MYKFVTHFKIKSCMKRLLLLCAIISTPMYLLAQDKHKIFKEINASGYLGGCAFKKSKEYSENTIPLLSVDAFTKRTHHHVQYDIDAGDIILLNVITFKEYYGAYAVLSKSTEEEDKYAGIGFERDFEIKKINSVLITFIEMGTGFEGNFKYSIGVLLNTKFFSFRK